VLVLGFVVRACLSRFDAKDAIWRLFFMEVASEQTSMAALREGAFLREMGRSPFEGENFLRPRFLIDTMEGVGRVFGTEEEVLQIGFAVVDVLIATIVIRTTRTMMCEDGGEENDELEKEVLRKSDRAKDALFMNSLPLGLDEDGKFAFLAAENAPSFAAIVYLFNPYTLMSSLVCNLASLETLALLISMHSSMRGFPLFAGIAFGVGVSLDLSHSALAVPLVLSARRSSANSIFSTLSMIVSACATFYCLNFLLFDDGLDWKCSLYWAHFRKLELRDLTPNIGLWWYFFTEVFQESKEFFRFVLLIAPWLYYMPLCITLRNRPQFLAHALMILCQMYKPCPDFAGTGMILTLISMHPFSLKRMRGLVLASMVIFATSAVLPVMRHMWLSVGSGNANYYYFQTLIFQFCMSSLVVEFVRTGIHRNAVSRDEYM